MIVGTMVGGCSIIPRNVEYFSKEVQKFPEKTETHKTTQSQAAEYVAGKTKEVLIEAIHENCSSNVVEPAYEANIVAESLSSSIGKPEKPWEQSATELSQKLNKLEAKLDNRIEDFKEFNNKYEGHSINGSGWEIGYGTNLIIILSIGAFLWFVLKIVSMAMGGPVSIGMNVASNLGGKLLKSGFSQVVAAGESIKNRIKTEINDPALQEKILQIFRVEQERKQSPEIQQIIKDLTKK